MFVISARKIPKGKVAKSAGATIAVERTTHWRMLYVKSVKCGTIG